MATPEQRQVRVSRNGSVSISSPAAAPSTPPLPTSPTAFAPAPAPGAYGGPTPAETAMTMQLRQALWSQQTTEATGANQTDDALVDALESLTREEATPRVWNSDIAVAEAEVTRKEQALPMARARRSGAMRLYFEGRIASMQATAALSNADQHMANRVAELGEVGEEIAEIGTIKREHAAANGIAVETRTAQCVVRDGAVAAEREAFGQQLEALQGALVAQCSSEVAEATMMATREASERLRTRVAAEVTALQATTAALRDIESTRETTRATCYDEAKTRATMLAESNRIRQDLDAAKERLRAASQARRVAIQSSEFCEEQLADQDASLRDATDEAAGIQFNIQHCQRDAEAANAATVAQRTAWSAAASEYSAKRAERTATTLDCDRADLARDVARAAEAAIAEQDGQAQRNLERWRSELHIARNTLARAEADATRAEAEQRAVEEERHVVAAEDANNAGIMHGNESILERVRAMRAAADGALAELREIEAAKAEEVASLDNEIGWIRPSLLHGTSVADMSTPMQPLAPMVKAQYDSASQLAVRMSDVLMKVYAGETINGTEKKMAELAMRIMTAEGYLVQQQAQAPAASSPAPPRSVRVSRNGSISIGAAAPSYTTPSYTAAAGSYAMPSLSAAAASPLPVASTPQPSNVRVNRHGSVSIGRSRTDDFS